MPPQTRKGLQHVQTGAIILILLGILGIILGLVSWVHPLLFGNPVPGFLLVIIGIILYRLASQK